MPKTLICRADHLRERMAEAGADRIFSLVSGYFDFAVETRATWIAIYEHRLPDGEASLEWHQRSLGAIGLFTMQGCLWLAGPSDKRRLP